MLGDYIAEAMWEDRPRNGDNESQEDNNDIEGNANENNEDNANERDHEDYDYNEVGMDKYAAC